MAQVNSSPFVFVTGGDVTGGSRTIADTNSAPGESVSLTATATDRDGTIASTQWLINGAQVATGTSATLTLPDGATVVTFRATDNRGATTYTNVTITVTPFNSAPNSAPAVAFVWGDRTIFDTNGTAGELVYFEVIRSDSDGTIESSQWLINGVKVGKPERFGPLFGLFVLADGVTTVTYSATDNRGATTSTTTTITVIAPPVVEAEQSPIPTVQQVKRLRSLQQRLITI